jgi:hypothetical protein
VVSRQQHGAVLIGYINLELPSQCQLCPNR